jgi:LysR family glycine cleavage system transcriptional activator
MRRTLPPLNALKAFEAAARHGSFVKAAHELGVTSAAVSQQVRLLEAHLGRQLFRRIGNRLILSDAGQTILPALSDGFEKLAQVTRLAQGRRPGRRIGISVLPSVAGKWLTRVLGEFLRRHRGYQIDLRGFATAIISIARCAARGCVSTGWCRFALQASSRSRTHLPWHRCWRNGI